MIEQWEEKSCEEKPETSHANPYTIIGISECGNVYVKDIWDKAHKRSLPPNQLKPYKRCQLYILT